MSIDSQKNSAGFSLLELIVAVVLIGLLATILVPDLRPRAREREQSAFVARLNALIATVRYNAIVTGKTHKVVFDLRQHEAYPEIETEEIDDSGQAKFVRLQLPYSRTVFRWDPSRFAVKDFIVANKDMLFGVAGEHDTVWFYLTPEGNAQQVTLLWYDTAFEDDEDADNDLIRLEMNPFFAEFALRERKTNAT